MEDIIVRLLIVWMENNYILNWYESMFFV